MPPVGKSGPDTISSRSESGISGFLGVETEKCYDVVIPETEVSFAVVGGGRTNEYITEGQLIESNENRSIISCSENISWSPCDQPKRTR